MRKIHILTIIVTLITGFLQPALAEELNEQHELAYKAYQQFLRSNVFLLGGEFSHVPSQIKKISIVRTSDKYNRLLSKRTNTLIADRITEKLLGTDRFIMIECLECNSKRISLVQDKLIIDEFLEKNENLRKIARKIDVDAFFLWDAFIDGSKVILNVKIVQAINGQILWSKQYSGPYDPTQYSHFNVDIYIGMLGYNLERKSLTPAANQKLNNMGKAGLRLRERFSALDRIEFSLGAEWFGSVANRTHFNFNGFAAEVRMVVDILPLMKHLKTNLYLAGGPLYYNKQTSLFIKYGIEVPFQRFGYVSFGGVYSPKNTIEMKSSQGYDNSVIFGGPSYDLTLGIRI